MKTSKGHTSRRKDYTFSLKQNTKIHTEHTTSQTGHTDTRKVHQETLGGNKHVGACKEYRSPHQELTNFRHGHMGLLDAHTDSRTYPEARSINEKCHSGLIDTRGSNFRQTLSRLQHNQVAIQNFSQSPQPESHARRYDRSWHARTDAVDLGVREMGSQSENFKAEGDAKHRYLCKLLEEIGNYNNNKADRHWPANSPRAQNSLSYTQSTSMQAPCVPAPPFKLPVDASACFGTDQIDVLLGLAVSNLTGTDMVAACKRALQFSDLGNVLGNFLVAVKYNLTDTMQRMIQVIRKNFVAISQTKEFLSLPLEYVLMFLEDSNLNVENELDVYAAALTWIDYNKQERIPLAGRILKSIRYAYIHPDDIALYVEPNLNLFTGQDGAEALVGLYKYHVNAWLPGQRMMPPKRKMPGMFDRTVIMSNEPCVTQDSRVFLPGTQYPWRPPPQQEPYRAQLDVSQLQAQPQKKTKNKVTFVDAATDTTERGTPAPNTPTGPPSNAGGTPAQASGTPAQASGTPAQANGTPAKANGTPAQASGPLAQANGTPAQANGTPAKANGTPAQASGTPAQASGTPAQANGKPAQASGTPAQANGTPAQANGTSAQANGTPAQASGTPAKPNGTPAQANGTPAQANGTPAQANGTAAQASGTPVKPNGTPAQANGTPAQANGTPAQASGTPAQTPQPMNQNASKSGTQNPPLSYYRKETTQGSLRTSGRPQDLSKSNRATSSGARATPIITHWDGSRRDVFRAMECVARARMEDWAERTKVEDWAEKNRVWLRLDEGPPGRRSEPPQNTPLNKGSRGTSNSVNRNWVSSRQSGAWDTKGEGKVFKVSGAIPQGPIILVSN